MTPTIEDRIKAFQKRFGLAVDGDVGPQTWAAVESLVALLEEAVEVRVTVQSPLSTWLCTKTDVQQVPGGDALANFRRKQSVGQ